MIFNKRYLFFLFSFLLIINNSQALEDQKTLTGKYFQIYTLHNDNSADINFQIIHINEHNEDIYDFVGINYTLEVTTFSKEQTYNHSIYSIGGANKEFKLVNHPPNSVGDFQITETITESSFTKGMFIHRVNFYALFGENIIPRKSMYAINLRFNVNNISHENKSENTIFLSGINKPENSSRIKYETYRIKVDLPVSPYFWSDYVSSIPIYPSAIISKGSGQSLFWDDFFGNDVIMLKYSITENPYPKRIDNLIEESNLILKETKKSNTIAILLGIFAFILASLNFFNIDLKKIISIAKSGLYNIKCYLGKIKK